MGERGGDGMKIAPGGMTRATYFFSSVTSSLGSIMGGKSITSRAREAVSVQPPHENSL